MTALSGNLARDGSAVNMRILRVVPPGDDEA